MDAVVRQRAGVGGVRRAASRSGADTRAAKRRRGHTRSILRVVGRPVDLRVRGAIVCLAVVVACAEGTVDLDPGLGPGGSLSGPAEDLAGRASTPVDLVLILDATVSMRVENERIVRDIGALVEALPPDLDLRVGVDLNDANATAPRERGRVTWAYRPEFPFATDVASTRRACSSYPHLRGCLTGASWVGSTPEAAEVLRRVVDVGNCSSGHYDVSLDSLARVLDEAREGGCNATFFRPGSRRVVVIISDGADYSEGGIDPLVSRLRALGDVRLAVLNGQREGRATRCGTGPTCGTLCSSPDAPGSQRPCDGGPGTCDGDEQCVEGRCLSGSWASCPWCDAFGAPDCCHAEPGARDVELASVFAVASGLAADACARAPAADARCLLGSICDEDLTRFFRSVGERLLGGARRFTLARPLECPGFARAFVSGGRFGATGVELSRGTELEAARDGRSVLVRGPRLPLAGERLRVVDGCGG